MPSLSSGWARSASPANTPLYRVGQWIYREHILFDRRFNVLGSFKAGAFSIAASLMRMIFASGTVSEALFNPAVTTATICSGRGSVHPRMEPSHDSSDCRRHVRIMGLHHHEGGRTFALKPDASTWRDAFAAELVLHGPRLRQGGRSQRARPIPLCIEVLV